jgi:hypothetical protein
MSEVYYDYAFNKNEWFIIIVLIIGHLLVFLLPKRFPFLLSSILYMFSITTGTIFDNTIGAYIFDLYDVGDSSKYTYRDVLSYIMYGPGGYLFIYVQDRFKFHGKALGAYIFIFCFMSLGIEVLGIHFGVFHYKNGYHIYYSYPIYVVTNSVFYWIYAYITQQEQCKNS